MLNQKPIGAIILLSILSFAFVSVVLMIITVFLLWTSPDLSIFLYYEKFFALFVKMLMISCILMVLYFIAILFLNSKKSKKSRKKELEHTLMQIELLQRILEILPEGALSGEINKLKVVARSLSFITNAKFNKAIRILEHALTEWVSDDSLTTSLGFIYFLKGRYKEAIKILERLTKQGIVSRFSCDILGSSYFHEKHYNKAIELLETAIKLGSRDDSLLFQLGVCYLEIQNYSKSIEVLTKYLDKNPEEIETLYKIGKAFWHMGDEETATYYLQRYFKTFLSKIDIKKLLTKCKK